jgi:predicted regulator of Ras-like GTPase activity (Roadblock/LC7/MglB family)
MAAMEDVLRALRDVDGVHGSFVITLSGSLVARELPSAFDHQLFAEVGPRIARLYETFLSGGEELDACVLRFSEHKLYLRKLATGFIGVLSGVKVNMPALRMVSNLVVRRVDAEMSRPTLAPPAPPPPPAPPTPSPPPVAVLAALGAAFDSGPPSHPAFPSANTTGAFRASIVAQDGRDSTAPPTSDRHVRMYRGRRVEE